MDEITLNVEDKRRCIDYTLLYKPNLEEYLWSTVKYIDLSNRDGVIFKPKKFIFGKDVTEFTGFELTEIGYRPTKEKMQAILAFPVPKNIMDI